MPLGCQVLARSARVWAGLSQLTRRFRRCSPEKPLNCPFSPVDRSKVKHWRAAAVLAVLAILAMSLSFAAPAKAADGWWNDAYESRLGVAIETEDALASGYSIKATINHAGWVSEGKSLSNGNDVRVARWNGSSWTQLDRVLAVGSSWNSGNTELYFRTQASIGASTTNSEYFIYYNNASADTPPANANNVYDLFDDFNTAGAPNASKWDIATTDGVTISNSGGELRVSGTADPAQVCWGAGVQSVAQYSPGIKTEVSVRSVSMTSNVQNRYWGAYGIPNEIAGVFSDPDPGATKSTMYWDGSDWVNIGPSTLQGETYGPVRVSSEVTSTGVARTFENGLLQGSRTGASTSPLNAYVAIGPCHASAFDVRYDDLVVRKFVENEPTVFAGTASHGEDIEASVDVDPELSMTVDGNNSSCNGVSTNSTSSGDAVNMRWGPAQPNPVAAQNLTVDTNAEGGYTIYARATQPLTSGSETIAHLGATNLSPAGFPGSGEGFGYTTDDASLGTGTANRFTSGGAKWAGLSVANAEVAFHPSTAISVTNCVGYQLRAQGSTAAGLYETSVAYTAVGNF
jgi:hypothetical protein